ncbi:Spc34p KNAG_0C01400 [Huiozyma naganishii CBS 8797]|uniref:DASH complex subunit SPC34 n=1 Tax=Huiozyma naganishii (strain ATCC MYA-139 / BCRC 22969 / CBS 8797 / KCTC 17520 / NBRC 10181 / NCYC 3082 / Yp74L-3) TaxID=1071383 RepID=J7RI90_HUIN7|nr:hypothetical protein KNAG_0C01400 [Kazachstania naganishii CBS 8797]CCK69253.1 hypothetical protein KNAG_0C01400 [Kazachstania naganishii CBS 8797]
MDQSLEQCLGDINQSIASLRSQNFKPPGIFHNSLVHHMVSRDLGDFAKILRDTKDQEAVMFKLDGKGVLRRKDGKEGVFDFLAERETKMRKIAPQHERSAKPLIQIPRKFNLEQQKKELADSSKWDGYSSSLISLETSSLFTQLLQRFADDAEAQKILKSLRTGGFIIEDVSPASLITILREVNKLRPVAENIKEVSAIEEEYFQLESSLEQLREEVKLQEQKMEQKYNDFTSALIERKHKELDSVNEAIEKLSKKAAA